MKRVGGVKVSTCGSLVWGVKKDGELRYERVDHWCVNVWITGVGSEESRWS